MIGAGADAGADSAAGGAGDVAAAGLEQAEAEGGGEPGGEATQYTGRGQPDSLRSTTAHRLVRILNLTLESIINTRGLRYGTCSACRRYRCST